MPSLMERIGNLEGRIARLETELAELYELEGIPADEESGQVDPVTRVRLEQIAISASAGDLGPLRAWNRDHKKQKNGRIRGNGKSNAGV